MFFKDSVRYVQIMCNVSPLYIADQTIDLGRLKVHSAQMKKRKGYLSSSTRYITLTTVLWKLWSLSCCTHTYEQYTGLIIQDYIRDYKMIRCTEY